VEKRTFKGGLTMQFRKSRLIAVFTVALLSSMVTFLSVRQAQAAVTLPVEGEALTGGEFSGLFTLQSFALNQTGTGIVATGTLTGVLTDAEGVEQQISQTVSFPVTFGKATCKILKLVLGPLDLDLLGLMVHLDKVVLTITAQQGGGLLGDLLCAIANLLNNPPLDLTALVNLLNQLLGRL
jgi:hypothetical protein